MNEAWPYLIAYTIIMALLTYVVVILKYWKNKRKRNVQEGESERNGSDS